MCTQLTQQICSNVAGILFPNVAYMLPQNLKWKPLSALFATLHWQHSNVAKRCESNMILRLCNSVTTYTRVLTMENRKAIKWYKTKFLVSKCSNTFLCLKIHEMLHMECFILSKENAQETYPKKFPARVQYSKTFGNFAFTRVFFQNILWISIFRIASIFWLNLILQIGLDLVGIYVFKPTTVIPD